MSDSTTGKHFWISIAAWLIFSLAFAIKPTFAQVFPVQANINVTPPYTVYLSHYTAPDQQRVMASVLLHDPVVTSLDVRFRFTIEGAGIRIHTNPGWIPAPFNLRSGITELISADIIAEYFRPQNVIAEGINPQELFSKGKLPEGFYQFKIEVLEYQRGVPISNVGRTGVWLLLNEPPRVVFPTPNQKVNATNPQILNFTWVPGGVTSPLSVLSTMYEFTLVELMGEVDPTVAITTASDAIKFTRTQQQTTLLYGPGEPQLIPGKRYAYRVRAYNTDGYELFKNNGYSEVRVFQFGDACNVPTMFSLTDETQSTFNIDVVSDPSSTAWQAQFRESGAGADLQSGPNSSSWSELKAEPGTSTKTVKGLKASTTYQVQLKSLCGTVSSSYTTPQTITTKEKVNTQRSCENSVSPFVVSQAEPLQQLKPNDIFLAALMPIKVTEVTSQGGGKFSGKGIATVPLFSAGLAVHFTDISINELMQLTAGEVIVERNAVNVTLLGDTDPTGNGSTTGNGTATDTTGNGGWPEFTDTINISSDIDSVVVVNDTTVWVYTSGGGDPVIVDMGGSDCLLIVPADGNMDNAQVVYNGAAKPYSAGSGNTSDTDEQYTGFRARFAPAPNTQYGFDSLRVQAYANQYNDLEIDGKTYKLPWKALPVNIPDPVTLHIRRSADSYPYSDLKVGIVGGNDLLPAAGANTATQTYNLTGTTDGDQYAVVAKYTQEGKSKYVGGLWAATYQKKEHKLYIVPLPGVKVSADTIGYLQNGLNQIYSQAVVSWTVQPLNGFTGVELGDNGLDWADKDMLSSYNAEMNSVISAFKDWKTDADPDAYYLFVVPQFSEGGVEGFMPRNRRFGFVTLSQLDARLVAHEIGHGAFNLRHTFPEVPQGSTDNLMDYSEGKTSLLKPQWDAIHDPQTMLFAWMQDESEGAYISETFSQEVARFINYIKCAKVKGSPTAEIHHGWNSYEVKIGSLISLLNYNGSGTITSTELSNAKLRVTVSHGYGSEPTDIFVGYQDITINVNQSQYTTQNGLNIPANKGGMYFSAPIGTSAELKTQIFNWLQKECGLTGGQPMAINVNNSSILKAKDVFLFSVCELEQINRSNRETLVRELMGNQEDWAGLDKDTYQYLLVNLLKTAPAADKAHFYKLFKDNPKWLSYLYGNMATPQRDKLMKILIELWYNNYSGNVNLAKAEAKNAFIVTNSIFGNASNYVGFSAQGEVIFTVPQIQVSEYMATESNEEVFRTAPFEPVFLGIKGDNSDKPFTVLPAICIKYYTDKGNMANMKEALMLTANAALFAVGVGEVVTGVRGAILVAKTTGVASAKFLGSCLRISLGVADLAASITSSYCNGANSGSEFCQTWKEYEFYINMGLLTASVSDMLYTKLSNSYTTNVKSNLSGEQVDFIENELGIAVRAGDNISTLIARWDNLTITEAKSLCNQLTRTDIIGSKAIRTQSDILTEVKQRGITNPYSFTYAIEDYTLTKDVFFVRCYTGERKIGRWLIAIDDMPSFSSVDDFIKRTALPVVESTGDLSKPSKVALIKIPSGTKIRKSIARPQDWGGYGHLPGGATQYEILDFEFESMKNWFKDIGNINEFIK